MKSKKVVIISRDIASKQAYDALGRAYLEFTFLPSTNVWSIPRLHMSVGSEAFFLLIMLRERGN